MIYARSSRPTLVMAIGSLALGLALAAASIWALFTFPRDVGALVLEMPATLALAFAVREGLRAGGGLEADDATVASADRTMAEGGVG